MGAVLGDLLPLAVGVAISPVPVIASILMLLSPRAGGTSLGFLIGWVAGIAVVTTLVALLAGVADLAGDDGGPSPAVSWILVALGVLLVLLAVRQWRGQPPAGEEVALPHWMSAIDSFTTSKALGLGFVLAAVNPKNLLMAVAAGTTVGASSLAGGEQVIAVAVFTVVAASTVAGPVLAYAVARERMRQPLDQLKGWLQVHNAAVMGVVLLVIGVVVIGKGLRGL